MKIILDNEKNIVFDTEKPPVINYNPLVYIPEGLYYLAWNVRKKEREILEYFGDSLVFLKSVPDTSVLVCYFHWFSISVVNYLRFVGMVDYLYKNKLKYGIDTNENDKIEINKYSNEYVKSIVPDIYIYRNKISAHFAATSPYKSDNLGTLNYSISHCVEFERPYFYACSLKYSFNNEEAKIPKWPLTKKFEDLSKRFWKNLMFTSLDKDYSCCINDY